MSNPVRPGRRPGPIGMSCSVLAALLTVVVVVAAGSSRAVMPQPQVAHLSGAAELSEGVHLRGEGPGGKSHRLARAFERYRKLFFLSPSRPNFPEAQRTAEPAAESINELLVTVKSADETLDFTTSERYTLTIPQAPRRTATADQSPTQAHLEADTIYGAMRGLETFSQLVVADAAKHRFLVSTGTVVDFPRFPWRGLLIDSSRHFLPVEVIKRQLDAMAYSKFNVLHWHIVDSQSFPYPSTAHPKLINGAYSPSHRYTQAQVAEVIEFALDRGVRVVPEFDTPGHSYPSWGVGYPELLTPCSKGGVNGLGPLNPINNYTYTFMDTLLREIKSVFPDKYVHLGGDEVSFECWQNNADITKFMQQKGWGSNYARLEQYYEQRLLALAEAAKLSYVVWQDPFDNGVKLAADTVVEVWRGGSTGWEDEMNKVTAAGYRAILSSPWYLNYISYGEDWTKYWLEEPEDFNGTAKQIARLMGGEACMWGEFVDATNLISRFFPRATAVGERLWSAKNVRDVSEAQARMHEFRCLLLRRGINAEPPNGPSFCPEPWSEPYNPPYGPAV